MDERIDPKWKSKRVEVEEEIEKPVPEALPKTIRLVLTKNSIMKVQGSVTKNIYVFNGAGSVLSVDERDAQAFLDMRRNSCNCSGMPGSSYFEIVGG